MMRQVIQRTVHGGVAGRDIYNIDLGNCTEYEAQEHFHQRTGISCTKLAREQLVYLGEQCEFHYRRELRPAIGGGALVWSKKTHSWGRGSCVLDYAMASIVGALLMALAVGVAMLLLSNLSGSHAIVGVMLDAAVLFFLLGLLHIQFVRPHRIAAAAMEALGKAPRGRFNIRQS
jgi:hypothetical protein